MSKSKSQSIPPAAELPDLPGQIAVLEAEIEAALGSVPTTVENTGQFIKNAPLYVDAQTALNATANKTILSTQSTFDVIAANNPEFAATLKGLESSLSTANKPVTRQTSVMIGEAQLEIPAATRDKPNALYQNPRTGEYFRIRADAMTKAIFGEKLYDRVLRVAGGSGFTLKPLVWVSQQVFHHISMDLKHEWDWKHADFNREADEAPSSPAVRAFQEIFDHLTVRNIIRCAKEHNMSIVDVVRNIIKDICDDRNVK